MSKKEREICEFEMDLNNFLFALQRLRNDHIISALRPGLKMGVENSLFWSEIGSGFEELGGILPLRIPRSNPTGLKALTGGGGEKQITSGHRSRTFRSLRLKSLFTGPLLCSQ